MPSPDPRSVRVTGWIGEHPADGSDVAHLLLFPASAAIGEGMEALAEQLGMVRYDAHRMAAIPEDVAHLQVSPTGATLVIADMQMPVPTSPDWLAAASAHRMAVLSVGIDPIPVVTLAAVDAVTSRTDRCWCGLITCATPPA